MTGPNHPGAGGADLDLSRFDGDFAQAPVEESEFQAIPDVKEDVLEIILNLKRLRFKCYSDEPVKLTLSVKGEKEVTAADIDKNSDVEVVTKKLHIATLTSKKAELEMEITVAKGRGYVPTEERSKEKAELGTIAVDALYSPIRNVGYKVDDVRVGQITNFDKLTLIIETDGTIAAEEAVRQSAKMLISHFELLAQFGGESAPAPAEEEKTEAEEPSDEAPEAEGESKPKKASKKKK